MVEVISFKTWLLIRWLVGAAAACSVTGYLRNQVPLPGNPKGGVQNSNSTSHILHLKVRGKRKRDAGTRSVRGNIVFLYEKCSLLRKEGNKQHRRMNQRQLKYFPF